MAAGTPPRLCVLLVGDDPASVWYARSKRKLGSRLGVKVDLEQLPANSSQDQLLAVLEGWNRDATAHGVIVELPMPAHLDKAAILGCLDPAKDVDGVTAENRGWLFANMEDRALLPATPLACLEMLQECGASPQGTRVCVVGRGDTVGRPLAAMLINRDATVTVCHTRTADLAGACRQAEVIVAAAGRPGLLRADMVNPGAVVIDAGTNQVGDQLVGDADPGVVSVAGWLTPVPGGVGTVTTSVLLRNVIAAADRQLSAG